MEKCVVLVERQCRPFANMIHDDDLLVLSGEVGRSWRYCNARPTRDEAGASS